MKLRYMFGLLVFETYLWTKLLDHNIKMTGLESAATINPEARYILRNPSDFIMTEFVQSAFPPCALRVRLRDTAQRVPFSLVSGSCLRVIFYVAPRRAPPRYLSHIICVVVTILIFSTERNNFRRPRLCLRSKTKC